ncbi:SMI1/KNR4 family protein [Pseudomonas viridiflava]|uniref:SMI1/KNR4 family protein n=1 Tax=Pseudomonas viridiflava TaxID=33069 RepID=A0ABU7N8V5_PSEVI|nr:SMI1/KNR4 family protein [Pseudomonas viridiflava]MEE4041381.1 SMI1/KNR4 family protein [Pseudomonas viridiflava]MEE4061621.1 SMI1/KNR4 family protein [Pseudomonas viridiflava]MEE4171026.1 SMI1/KNR4 family protein [Pseudomonas viridiflava]
MPLVYKRGLSNTEIDRVELEIGRSLPYDFKKLLSWMNGFYLTSPDYSQIPLASVEGDVISFDRIFGLLPDEECNDLIALNNEFIDELGFLGEAVAIGEDGGGNPYVLLGEERGGLYYWDRTHLHDFYANGKLDIPEQSDCGNLFYLAPSFQAFYDMILKSLGGSVQSIEES